MLTRHALYRFLFFALPIVYFLSLPISVGDLAIWVAQGRQMLASGTLLRHDPFSFLSTHDLVYPAALCVIYGLIDRLGGLLWVSLAHKAIVVGVLAIWYATALRPLRAPWTPRNFFWILFAWWGSASLCIDRPALVATLPFLAAFILLMKEEALAPREVVYLLLINVIWVNLHGSWLVLAAMLGWRIGVRRLLALAPAPEWRALRASRLELAGFFGVLITSLANPFGFRVFAYALETVRVSRERRIDEWMPTDLTLYYPQGILFYVLFAGALGLVIALSRSDRRRALLLLASPYLPLCVAGVLSVRNTIWPFVALLPLASRLGLLKEQAAPSPEGPWSRRVNAALAAAVFLVGVALLPQVKPWSRAFLPPAKRPVFDRLAPVEFARYLALSPARGRIFNDWDFGSYLALAQPNPIFIDTRNVIYGETEFAEYLTAISASPGWEEILGKYEVRYALLAKPQDAALISRLRLSPVWRVAMEDEDAILFERVGGEPQSHSY